MRILNRSTRYLLGGMISISLCSPAPHSVLAQAPAPPGAPTALGMENGTMDFSTPDFALKLVKSSQTIAALLPAGGAGFDFTPSDRLAERSGDGFFDLGDLTLRLRSQTSGDWTDYSTAKHRQPVTPLPTTGGALASSDLTPTLDPDCPLQITRTWALDSGKLVLKFDIKNKSASVVQIGALGIPMVFNNIITNRELAEAHEKCAFSDPYIGQDAGYLQVTRLSGHGPTLIVTPYGKTPFEAYQLLNEPRRPEQTFEGMMNWLVHTEAYAEKEWRGVKQWNAPTMASLAPGETRTYGVKFLLSDTIRHIDKTLEANKRPLAIGIPGYVLPMDQDGRLFLKYPQAVKEIRVEPAGAIATAAAPPARNGWKAYALHGKTWGRARLTVTYADGLKQTVSYYVIKPAARAVADMGRFLTTKQWFVDPQDPFGRSPSVISYDREADKQVTQDSRVWISGLGDEGGSGAYVAAAMKEFGQPSPEEVAKYEQFVDGVLWGGIQYKDGPNKYGVRKSMFYYDPKGLPNFQYDPAQDWRSWTSWNKKDSEDIGRGYNYPHVVAAYWAMYRVARNHPGMVKNHPWDWYLDQAYQTTMYLTSTDANGDDTVGYMQLGLMEGDVFLELLKDVKREGWTDKAAALEARMKTRADRWSKRDYPFGSEMAWDSTGQEEVYSWSKYFGYDAQAEVTLSAILGYMPTLPHWGYNGDARRYWDFLYGGKLSRIERQIHHYGSGLNAIPVLKEYRDHPDDYYLLRVGYGGVMGPLSNIDQDGFASAAFHTFPSTLKWDAYSGDYGPNFFGHALDAATYVIDHPDFGWQAFGGNVTHHGDWIAIHPRDSFRSRVYIAPRGLWLTLDAGAFDTVEVNTKTNAVRIGLVPKTKETPLARLLIEQPAKISGVGAYHPSETPALEHGAYPIALKDGVTWVKLNDR
ncbi:hypothetical protein CCAX7_40580 [Capsulimonas corticalis]|uniref:Uncharacterized protein n=1 Tax=Capsulimonas corticalis TaxID=2219043 RepID=A0A402D6F7_9BACT|nr:DUF5695 domain-containing protein [Capsulimonas corticalis]BDI32007.1 hypothetical protein CCAX7_40580 [Capsulimonas corticalis]